MLISAKVIPQADNPYDKIVNEFLADESLKNASVSFCVLDAKTRHQVYGYEENRSLMPASNMKIITTATAAEMFGPTHQFKTKLAFHGDIEEGVLSGDILIIGGGDPTLGSSRFGERDVLAAWVMAIKDAGISHVLGQVIAVDTIFSGQPIVGSTATGDVGNYYGAGAHGINWRDNQVDIHFESDAEDGGETKVLRTNPEAVRLELINHVLASNNPRDNAYIHGSPGTWERCIYGTIPKGKTDFVITASMPDPAHQLASELHFALVEQGVKINHQPMTSADQSNWDMPERLRVINEWLSPPMKDILVETNRKSVNTYADVLLKHIGLRFYNTGDYFSGIQAIVEFWSHRGVPREGWYQEDGSGLSRANSITSKQLALVVAKINPEYKAWFKKGLKPMAGDPEIVAKSGHITRVRAYTGFIMVNGVEYAFSILCNNFSCSAGEMRRKIETLMASIKGARLH
jgi:D-alanyl-D-alanine carboxypeptidase/D-alanyl-D-alanine-endopeptidase (penicillin-binding protein 4)